MGDEGTSDLGHPSSLLPPQTVGLKAIGVHCLRHLQCHPSQTAQTDLDIPDEAGGIKKKCV